MPRPTPEPPRRALAGVLVGALAGLGAAFGPARTPAVAAPRPAEHDGELDVALDRARAALAGGDEAAARAAFEHALALDPDNAEAHRGLRHHAYEGRWYATHAELALVRREEARRMLRDHGLVRHAGDWVPRADVPFLRMGWVRDPAGTWLHPAERAARALADERRAAGWERQDAVWIPPEEFDPWRAGLWKVGDRWLAEAEANAVHASRTSPWVVPTEHFELHTTLDREDARWAAWWADRTVVDLERLFGPGPERTPRVWVLRDMAQYNAFCAGDADLGLFPAEATGWSSLHYACFGDALFDNAATPPTWRGAGVCWWDRDSESLDPYGQHAVRHAAAQAWIDGIDPSWDAVSLAVTGQSGTWNGSAFWAEKRVPLWLRYGAASYCERYFVDDQVAEGGDPLWARTWGLANLRAGGPLSDLPTLFACALDTNRVDESVRLVHEAGAVVAFVLDGGCAPVDHAHEDLRRVLRDADRATVQEAARDLERAIVRHREELEAFLGL